MPARLIRAQAYDPWLKLPRYSADDHDILGGAKAANFVKLIQYQCAPPWRSDRVMVPLRFR